MNLFKIYISFIQDIINKRNQKRLTNKNITLICSNCTGGVLYHWLNLEFMSPFINLYMDNKDFILAMENFDEFISSEILEDKESSYPYPVGVGCHGERIHFMHYDSFSIAINKWNERKLRINRDNIAIMLTNFGAGLDDDEIKNCINRNNTNEDSIIKRFESLPFKNKIILSGYNINSKYSFQIKQYPDYKPGYNIFRTQNIFGKRYIDQFDYVSFINKCAD